jgi:hypothetical protein
VKVRMVKASERCVRRRLGADPIIAAESLHEYPNAAPDPGSPDVSTNVSFDSRRMT